MDKFYYKIYKVIFQSVCPECQKKDIVPDDNFIMLIDETEVEVLMNNLGSENRLIFKRGGIDMKYVAGVKFYELSERLLEDAFQDLSPDFLSLK